jgi:Fe-S-cluster containining protein
MSFHCDRCGLCCRLLTGIPQLAAFDRGDGVCRYLVDNLCSIYENRPDICNVDKMYIYFSSGMTHKQYDKLMEDSCKLIKKKFAEDNNCNIDPSE